MPDQTFLLIYLIVNNLIHPNILKLTMIKQIIIFPLLLLGITFCQAQNISLSSPSGNIKIEVSNDSQLNYRVLMDGKVIIGTSPLGFSFKNEPDMGTDLQLTDQKETTINESWSPVIRSKHAEILDHYKATTLDFAEKSGLYRKMKLEFRAYNDGIAFRYQLFSGFKIGDRNITQELTGFNFNLDHKVWIADYKSYTSSQEKEFSAQYLSTITPLTRAGLPFLIEIDKTHYAAITEAKINNYPGFYIGVNREASLNKFKLITKLSPLPSEEEAGVKARLYYQTCSTVEHARTIDLCQTEKS